jgi:hypothetical protein
MVIGSLVFAYFPKSVTSAFIDAGENKVERKLSRNKIEKIKNLCGRLDIWPIISPSTLP